jgi:hypothetical protein
MLTMSRSAERSAMAAPRRARHNRLVSTNAFWDDLVKDLGDSEFWRAYESESVRIAAVDAAINAEALAFGAGGVRR